MLAYASVAKALQATGAIDVSQSLADMVAQQKEYKAALDAGKDATYLAGLAIVQQMETTAKAIAKVQTVIDGLTATIDGLQGFKDSLALSEAVSPADRLKEAQRQYDAIVAAAKAGDQGAAGRLPGAANTLLDAARTMFAQATPEFQAVFAKVNQDTDTLIKFYQDQRSVAQQQLDALIAIQKAQEAALEVAKQTKQTIEDNGSGGTGGIGSDDGVHKRGGGDSSGDSANIAATVTVLQSGFMQTLDALNKLNDKVDAQITVTRNGFEGQLVNHG